MSIKIDEWSMTSDVTRNQAYRLGAPGGQVWTVTWLGDEHPVDHNQAVSAMVIAEYVAEGRADAPLVRDLAGELGMPETEAVYRVMNSTAAPRPGAFTDEEIDRCHEATEFDHRCRVCDPLWLST